MNSVARFSPATQEYMRRRLTGWVLYNSTSEFIMRRVMKRLGEAELRRQLGV